MTSLVKNSMPQLVWWMTNHSRVPEQLVRDHQRTNRIVAGAAAGVADHVRVAFCQAGKFRRVEPRVHARQDGKSAGRWHRKCAFAPKLSAYRSFASRTSCRTLLMGVLLIRS